ncbi:NUDIX hydrolase [Ornithinibacillus xuwenensis]|uniref:NUDIX hydrolase n=1 Tax=Ornithinibacillus xuwenensis TaxID=3144668 RepID=A0ABU9XJU4_9BACI
MDISVQLGEGIFNFRVGVILMNQERVLLHRGENDDFWALPGGRVTMFESTVETAVREIKEEIGVDVTVNRLLWHTENFFTFDEKAFHEIANYYKVDILNPESINLGHEPFKGIEQGSDLIYQWFPITSLSTINLYPVFLRNELARLPEHPRFLTITQENL